MLGVLRLIVPALCVWLMLAGTGRAQSSVTELDQLSDDQLDQAVQFMLGNALFVLMHESGHMLISEFGLPVLGREEDAVDALSTLIMLEADDETFDNALIDASDGWFLDAEAAEAQQEDYAFWDEHSVDEQRGYAIICMMVGKDTQRFSSLEAAKEMPEDRRERCASDYQKTSDSWDQVLTPHLRPENGESAVNIVYDDAPSAELEPYVEMFRAADLLGIVKSLIADQFVLEDGITFRATSCGVANAFWDPAARTLTFCYELSQLHARLIAGYFAGGGR